MLAPARLLRALSLTLALGALLSGCGSGGSGGGAAAATAGVSSASPTPTTSGSAAASGSSAAAGVTSIVNTFAATGLGGVYDVAGSDAGLGAYTGRVELRWTGSDYEYLREVEYSAFRQNGRPLSTVWTGRGQDDGLGGVTLTISLARMGFASEAPGIPARTAADGTPMRVTGAFQPQAGRALQGGYLGQGAPFGDPQETWTWASPPLASPIWVSERSELPSHDPPSPRTRSVLFAVFGSYHQTAWIRPYVTRPEFQAAVHRFVYDRTDFDLHRRRPDLLRLIDQLVDPLALEEATLKANAFGKRLHEKAAAADAEVPQRFLEPAGCLAEVTANGHSDENDGALWTGVYCYSQAMRYQVTGETAARDNALRTAAALRTMMVISGQPDQFARTLRTASGQPLGGNWSAGTGAYAGLEWKQGGNNDMFKGLLLGGLALLDGPGQPLRADYGAALSTLAAGHPVTQGWQRQGNALLAWGLVGALTGDQAALSRYRSLARNPFNALSSLLPSITTHYQGICDWSGTHLNIVGLLIETRLAEINNDAIAKPLTRLALRRVAAAGTRIRRTIHSLVCNALAPTASVPFDDVLWALRELPFPRSDLGVGFALRDDFCASPYPSLPWKLDWTTNQGRAQAIVAPPLWELPQGSYAWKNCPFPRVSTTGPAGSESASGDYLFAYWFGRRHGLIPANE
ncbi:MAG: hypothetical protein AB7N76_20280 [Planctomycetota bacterium]